MRYTHLSEKSNSGGLRRESERRASRLARPLVKKEAKLHLTFGLWVLFLNLMTINLNILCALWCLEARAPAYGTLVLAYGVAQFFFATMYFWAEVRGDRLYQRSAITAHLPGLICGLLLLIHMPTTMTLNLRLFMKIVLFAESGVNASIVYGLLSSILSSLQ